MITNRDISIDSENGKITLNGNKYDLGTQGEIDAAVKDVYSVMGQNGAKNLIPYPYYNESGHTDQGMTITYDADGVFTINKVAGTAMAYYRIATMNFLKPSTKYRLVVDVENATSISIFLQKPTSGDYVTINNKSSGRFTAEFETTSDSQTTTRSIGLSCTATDTETNATVKVMIVLASDTDNTYQPYAMTNKQLTTALGTKQDTLTFDTTPTDESTNPVTSGGVYTALAGKEDTLTFDNAPTVNSTNPVKSGGVYSAVAALSGNFTSTQYTDFNDLPHGSIVQIPGSAAHVPGSSGHYYIVFTYFIGGTTTFKSQFAIENTDGYIYTRDCANGTWGNWNKFAKATS